MGMVFWPNETDGWSGLHCKSPAVRDPVGHFSRSKLLFCVLFFARTKPKHFIVIKCETNVEKSPPSANWTS